MDNRLSHKLKKSNLKKKAHGRGMSKTANLSPSKGEDLSKKAN